MSDSFTQSVWCVVPVYNNPETVVDVVRRCCGQISNVLVIDDGSTQPIEELLGDTPATVLRHEQNRGKGEALRTALRYVKEQGGEWMIALDDGDSFGPANIFSLPYLIQDGLAKPKSVITNVKTKEKMTSIQETLQKELGMPKQ